MSKENTNLEKKTALTTAIIAVFLAISSILGNNAGQAVLVNRGLANDYWAYYQARSIKQSLYEVNKTIVEVDLMNPQNSEKYGGEIQTKLAEIESKIEKYEKDKESLKATAEGYEAALKKASKKQMVYDIAAGCYQLSIILAAVSALLKNSRLWKFSCVVGAAAILQSFFAFFRGGV